MIWVASISSILHHVVDIMANQLHLYDIYPSGLNPYKEQQNMFIANELKVHVHHIWHNVVYL